VAWSCVVGNYEHLCGGRFGAEDSSADSLQRAADGASEAETLEG
jgi:hypothetical protein